MKIKPNWIVTVGTAEVTDNKIHYKSTTFTNQLGKEEILTSVVKSNVQFENGEISFKLNSKDKNGRCQLIFNYGTDAPMVIVGINVLSSLYGIAKQNRSTNNFESLYTTGLSETFATNKEYFVKIKLNGSIIELFVNDVLVASAFEQITPTQATFFLSSSDDIIMKDIIIETAQPKAFVIMQFTEEYNHLYTEVIKPVVEDFGYECIRADETFTTNPILQDITQSIIESSVIIADITPNNPNVFYEVGYAHAIEKPTILLCDRKRDKLPFDISGFRTLFYDNTIAGKSIVEKSLKKYLEAL